VHSLAPVFSPSSAQAPRRRHSLVISTDNRWMMASTRLPTLKNQSHSQWAYYINKYLIIGVRNIFRIFLGNNNWGTLKLPTCHCKDYPNCLVTWSNVSNTKDRVWPHFQTPRKELKIRRAAEYFDELRGVWKFVLSIETKAKEKTEKKIVKVYVTLLHEIFATR